MPPVPMPFNLQTSTSHRWSCKPSALRGCTPALRTGACVWAEEIIQPYSTTDG